MRITPSSWGSQRTCQLHASLITDGESRVAEVLRVVPFLVVDGNMATLGSLVLPMMENLQRTISIQVNFQIKLCSPATAPENSLDDPQV
mgnify:CR=1 FL=1